ncbi:Patellin-6 [Camellia lanceoleosa]|uniref:Patellin-6 n=1 Tax=Camellia lanceoleosa TaxID=1840588 RepID=A0ACC0GCA0_9ERIC|nr:Patellin-6 [Camellia lanceoleosa]
MHGFDREGHPVCYNAYGVFKDKDMYDRIFGDDEKLQEFPRWRVQVLERGLSFCISNPVGLTRLFKSLILKTCLKESSELLPITFSLCFKIITLKWSLVRYSSMYHERSTQTSLRVHCKGEKVNIQIEGIEAGATITWDIVVGGWDLDYSAEFVPIAEGSYTIAVEKSRRIAATEEAIHNSFTAREAGKMVFSVDNTASRKRKVAAYRYVVRKSTAI